jgi:hypothetical protein
MWNTGAPNRPRRAYLLEKPGEQTFPWLNSSSDFGPSRSRYESLDFL